MYSKTQFIELGSYLLNICIPVMQYIYRCILLLFPSDCLIVSVGVDLPCESLIWSVLLTLLVLMGVV